MNRFLSIITILFLTLHLSAQSNVKQQLQALFQEAERCYLMDDYQQLESCLTKYDNLIGTYSFQLSDSLDVFMAYYYKMCGSYYYGFAENHVYANYSELGYRRSLDIFNQRNNEANALALHEELAQLYYKTKAYGKAKVQLDSVFNYYDERLHDMGITSVQSNYYKTISQLAMCNARLGLFNLALNQIDEAIKDYYKKKKDADYYEVLRKRGKILMLQADSLGATHYKKAVDSYQRYVNERYTAIGKEMSMMNDSQRNQYWLSTHQFLYDCFRLGNLAPEMLYDLTLFSKDYLIRKNASQTKWTQVRKALGKKDCAIEFVQYFGKRDEKRLGCLVLKSNSKKPLFIDLFSTDSVLNLQLTERYTIGHAIEDPAATIKDTLYNDGRLPQIIWSPQLLTAIGNAQKIYFAPDGMLNQFAIEYLMPDTTKECYRLSSTRVLTLPRTTPKTASALLCGGIEYSIPIQPNDRNNDVVAYRYLATQDANVNYLSWTRNEVDSIYAVRHNPNDTLLLGKNATDETFLMLLKKNYDIIHLSTHGYYGGRIGINNDIKPLLGDESMSKSGVLLAGSANTIADKNFDEDLFDGVLSANELSKQDLSKTELIVLSACQTGLGHLTDDGIYGIQRGLKQAGANAMILSLWSVNDYSSYLLMRFFYEELEKQSTKDIHAAFLCARQRVRLIEESFYLFDASTLTIKKEIIRYNTPRHINPFILVDAY